MIPEIWNALQMALLILFINATTWEGMIWETIVVHTTRLFRYKTTIKDLMDRAPQWIAKPGWDCIICMSPWWATGIGLPIFYGGYHFTQETIAFILTTGGISVLIDTFVLGKREGI